MRITTLVALLSLLTVLQACSSSSESTSSTAGGTAGGESSAGSTSNGTTSNGTTSDGATTGDTAGNTAGSNTAGNSNISLLDAGLSHAGTPTPQAAAVANDPNLSSAGSNRVAQIADNLAVIFEVVNNQGTSTGLNCSALGAQYNSCSIVNLHVKDAAGALNDTDWKLFFHSTRRILQVQNDEFDITHVNGDLHFISPKSGFSGFAGDTKSIKMITEYNHLVETDFQPRYWIARGASTQLIANTDEETDESRYAMPIEGNNRFEFVGETNQISTPTLRYTNNIDVNNQASQLSASAIQARIIPRPSSVTVGTGSLDVSGGFSFSGLPLPAATISALQSRQNQFMSTAASTSVQALIDQNLPSNSYSLTVAANGINLSGSNETMLFYAAQSLLGLVQPGVGTIPLVTVTDSPRFDYRGIHIDVARNFHSVSSIKKLLDQMAAYKLNKLHMHLSDDEGWRLAIPTLPELTTVGAKREFNVDADGNVSELNALMPAMGSGPNSNNQGSGFYSQAEFIDLLAYAKARYIDVVPEIDMPAHARAAVVSMRARAHNLGDASDINIRLDDPNDTSRYLTVQNYYDSFINPCVPGTYTFLRTVISAVADMYTAAGVPLAVWHMGGDEAVNIFKGFGFNGQDTSAYDEPWAKSPVCTDFIANTAGVNSVADLTPYFIKEVAQIVADAGIPALFAYQDIYRDQLTADSLATAKAGVGFWAPISSGSGINDANSLSNRGFDTIISSPDYLYLDFPYEVHPEERGYYWATRQTDTKKIFSFAPENLPQNAETSVNRYGDGWTGQGNGSNAGFTGMQASLWGETVRTPEHFDYMLFPRVLAVAERAWHNAAWELPYVAGRSFSNSSANVDKTALNADYAEFAAAIGLKELPKLDAASVSYRVPLAGASNSSGSLQMNTAFPGLALEYSQNGSNWQTWDASSAPSTALFVRTRSANNARTSRIDTLQ